MSNKHEYRRPHFIAIDGEGIGKGNRHRYTYLAADDGIRMLDLLDINGLSTRSIFDFLLDLADSCWQFTKPVFVVYGASYDFNMWLKDIDWNTLSTLWRTNRCEWQGYRLELKNRKSLRIQYGQSKILIYDVLGFFQQTFVKAIADWLGTDEEDYATIEQQKKRRSQFRVDEIDSIRSYCQMELRALRAIMERLAESMETAGLHLSRWDGAGAAASALLRKYQITKCIPPIESIPPEVNEAARTAYFGGRIEVLQYGHTHQPIHHYDINSAYPAAIQHLPNLTRGHWVHYGESRILEEQFSVYRVRWSIGKDDANDIRFYPFPYRTARGEVLFPSHGEGWYWRDEVTLPYRLYPGEVHILESWIFVEDDSSDRPYAFIPELYRLRREWKQDGNRAHYALKLALNSLYGKHVQHVGATQDKIPSSHSIEWGGFITAYCRAKLYEAAMQKPESIICFQTDGIYSLEPLNLNISTELGEWEYDEKTDIVSVQSGVYWTQYETQGETIESQFYRGFDPHSLERQTVIDAYRANQYAVKTRVTRFVTMGGCVHNPNLRPYWRTWRTTERQLQLALNGKRVPVAYVPFAADSLQPTRAALNPTPRYASTPYPLPWSARLWTPSTVDGIPETLFDDDVDDSLA